MAEHTPESIDKRLAYLATLEDGWLDGDGKKIDPHSIQRCREFLRVVKPTGFSIFPTEAGYVQLEWIDGNEPWGFEIEFDGDEDNTPDSLWVLRPLGGLTEPTSSNTSTEAQ